MDKVKIAGKVIMTLPASPFLHAHQHTDKSDQHTDNEQRGGIVLEIVHGMHSFVFVPMAIRRRGRGNVPGFASAEPKGLAKRAGIC